MSSFWSIFILLIAVVGISVVLMNIRHIFTGQEFRGSCATNNPMIKNEHGECTVCGSKVGENCQNPETA